MRSLALFIILLVGSGCTPATVRDDNLYDALGAEAGIASIVDAFLGELGDNEAVLPLFVNTDIARFRTQLASHLCSVAGGPCVYEGDSMQSVHRGMNISRAQFNSVVENLVDAMERSDVPTAAQNALLARLAPLFGDIAAQ